MTVDEASIGTSGGDVGADERSWFRATWPVDRRQWARLGLAFVACVGIFTAIGMVLTDLAAPNVVTRIDEDVAERFASNRTPLQDDLAHWGSFIASTEVKVGLTALFAIAAIVAWRRWHEPVFLAFTLIFEATVFIIVTFFVARPRPDVPRLEDSPVDSSYPSGHVAAATVYGAFVVIVFWHTTSRWWRSLAVAAFVAVVGTVAWSRMYQGMHFLSDVVAGIVLGLVSLGVCLAILGRPRDRHTVADGEGTDRAQAGSGPRSSSSSR
ncbi:MAG: phosphatase PAP2 family protein [Ilumatobacteraceae bacterium]